MMTISELAVRWLDNRIDTLSDAERNVLQRILAREPVARNINDAYEERLSFGDKLADIIARIGGSWGFIAGFCVFLGVWVVGNTWMAAQALDPYPFIFLNLILSMLAAFQAPIIMMSQNRQSRRDRIDAAHDYEVNLKAEIEIMALHEKFDLLRDEQIAAILAHLDALASNSRRPDDPSHAP